MRSTVVLIPIDTYDQPRVDAAVREGVTLLGGLAGLVDPGERVLLKPNLLGRAIPEKAVTTHPAVFSAVCRLMREEGYAHLSYGDSPGNPSTTPVKAAQACGVPCGEMAYVGDTLSRDVLGCRNAGVALSIQISNPSIAHRDTAFTGTGLAPDVLIHDLSEIPGIVRAFNAR